MGWQDWGDVRAKRGTPIKKWPVYEDGALTANRARVERKKHNAQLKAEAERKAKMDAARRRKAEQDRQKQAEKERKAEEKKARKEAQKAKR